MIFNEEFETLPREALEALQLKRLKQVAGRVYHTVGFYKTAFDEAGIIPDDIKTLDDLKRLPFTTKENLRENYPFGLFTVPMSNIVRLHASSGITGKPTVVGYTRRDIEIWSRLMARSLVAAGLTSNDIIHNAYGYGLFTGGLGIHYGAEMLGSSVIPMSGGSTKKQIMILQDFGPTAICSTPSYALYLAGRGEEMGVDMRSLRLRVGILGAEPWSEKMREEIEDKLGIRALDMYGLSEVIGPGVAMECAVGRDGMHVFEDHFIVETINPETGETVPYGEEGELVFTSLTKEAFPLIRYRTGDISRLMKEPCRCGRTYMRIARISGRSDDMLIIRGVNVFPSEIESVFQGIEGLGPHYELIVDRENNLDTLEIRVEMSEDVFSDEIRILQKTEQRITKDIKDYLGVIAKVKLVGTGSLERSEGTMQRVVDNRKV